MYSPISIKAISFDAGGTLLYPHPSVGIIYAEVMEKHGMNLTPDVIEKAFVVEFALAQNQQQPGSMQRDSKEWWRILIVRLFIRLNERPADIDRLFEDLWNTFADPAYWKLFPDARETLIQLRRRGYQLALLSNWDERLRILLDGLGITEYFDAIIISSEVECEKPDRAIFQHLERRLGVAGHEILHVGDSAVHDIHGAREAGWQSLLVSYSASSNHASRQISTLKEVMHFLE